MGLPLTMDNGLEHGSTHFEWMCMYVGASLLIKPAKMIYRHLFLMRLGEDSFKNLYCSSNF